ncbi:MAG: response regulator [Candidatus Moranbacteria bacterium]|nr:response regulator [Candidatus Moranbacteria bacterium]
MPKILFVEDDPFIAEIYKKKFASSGFDVLNVITGKSALKEALEQKFDLILLDLVIPELSGTEVLRELRHNPEYDPNMKIVVFSNLSSQEDRDECLGLGANGFISKTEFSPSEVVVEVNRFLSQFSEQAKNSARFEKQGTAEHEDAPVVEGKKILFVEDEAVFIDMFGKRLRDEGYVVTTCRDGVSGLQAALDGTFDLVISDVMMPGMDGRELVMKLKEAESENNTPIFLFSASLDDRDVQALIDSKIAERVFLKTQITPSELTYAVNDFFKEQSEK